MLPGLYIVSTPIGNLKDITLRAIETLQNSSHIFCEDTRSTIKLLDKYGINAKLHIYNDHSKQNTRDFAKSLILSGNVISLVSDAGTPLISDPGFKLVQYLRQENIHIDVVPGVCAPIAALTISGLAPDSFFFGGFIPKSHNSKIKFFAKVRELDSTLIFFETANRLLDTLKCAHEAFGDRFLCITREITKMYQEVKFDKTSNMLEILSNANIKGEIVLLIEGYRTCEINSDILTKEIVQLIEQEGLIKSVVDILCQKYHKVYSKNKIYSLVKAEIIKLENK